MEESAMAVAKIAGPIYLLLGLSFLLYAPVYKKLMAKWQKDHLSLFPLMLLTPIFGLLIIGMHNVWVWNVGLLVTLIGWGLLLKGVVYFLLPGQFLKSSLKMAQNVGLLYLAGLGATVVGGVLGYFAYFA